MSINCDNFLDGLLVHKHLKYIHYHGNEANDRLLEANGIVTKQQEWSKIMQFKTMPQTVMSHISLKISSIVNLNGIKIGNTQTIGTRNKE